MMPQEFEIENIGVPEYTIDPQDNQVVYKLRVNNKTLNKKIHNVTRLHDQLQHALPNTTLPLPHLPGLSYYDRFLSLFSRNQREGSFFQDRLDKYFKDLAKIPEVVNSTHFRIFLEAYDISGKVAFVLGPTSGIGKEISRSLVRMGAQVFLVGRHDNALLDTIREFKKETPNANIDYIHCDLNSFSSVRECARAFSAKSIPLHYLVMNAGVGSGTKTEDGFQEIFGVNYLSHFLLSQLLLDELKRSAPSRLVFVSSRSHQNPKNPDISEAFVRRTIPKYTLSDDYGVSKLCLTAYATELAERLKDSNVGVFSVHPGVVATNFFRHIPLPQFAVNIVKKYLLTSEEGAFSTLVALLDENLPKKHNGAYLDEYGCPDEPNKLVNDPKFREDIWEKSVRWTNLAGLAADAE